MNMTDHRYIDTHISGWIPLSDAQRLLFLWDELKYNPERFMCWRTDVYWGPEKQAHKRFFTIELCRTSEEKHGFPAAADGTCPEDFSRISYRPGFDPDYPKDATCRVWDMELRTDQNGDPYLFLLMKYITASESFRACPLFKSSDGGLHLAIMPAELKELRSELKEDRA